MKRSKSILLFLLLSLTIALSGCGGDTKGNKGDNKESGNGTPIEDDTTAESNKTPVYGGSVIVGIQNDLDSLDPHKAKSAGTREVLFNMFEGLVKPDKDGNLVPAVAKDVIISKDGKTLSFPLRENVKFHNGAFVTVDDVIYSIKRCAGLLETSDPEVKVERALSCITSVEEYKTEDGKLGVQIKLNEANNDVVGYLTCAIIPKGYDQMSTKPVGTGPFKFVSYTPLQNLVMEKNPDYYVEGLPYLDQVTFKVSANTDSAMMALLAGNIDVYPYLTAEQANQLKDTYNIKKGAMNLVQGLYLNNAVEPFNNKLVRQAMCYAIDRQMILDMVADGNGTIVGTPIFPQFKKYYAAELADQYAYNVQKAKDLLSEAGYPNGFSFTITVPSNYQFHVDTAQVIVELLKQVGIDTKIQLVEWETWVNDVYAGRNYQSTIVGLDANMTPSNVCFRYVSTDPKNFINYSNPKYDEIYAKAIVEIDDNKKIEYYKQLQQLLSEDAASVYIQDAANIVALNKKLAGYEFYPLYVQDMSLVHYVE
ncbi:MAG: ABC transporter substrate-binding protein [Clostridiales bacterium]|nr:ABC transporter substrate-binding protein [Clostridiales bacterium]